MNVAIIPARGGSKRIPKKNIRQFHGKPMICWSIEAAIKSGVFEKIIVSTDDAEIKDIAMRHGAEVPFLRPDDLSNDYSGTTEVIAHAIQWLEKHGIEISDVCCIYATAPFINISDLKSGYEKFHSGKWDYVFSATEYAAPIFRSFHEIEGGAIEMYYPEHFNTRSQDLPVALHDAAQFYWGKPGAWKDNKPIFGPQSTVVRIPRWRVQDIDTEEDWHRAELLAPIIFN